MARIVRCALLMLCLTGGSLSPTRAEDPNPEKPFEALQSHGVVPEAQSVRTQIAAADAEIRKLLAQLADDRVPDARRLGQVHVAYERLVRWTDWLVNYREPAAIDFEFRKQQYAKAVYEQVTRFWGSPASGPVRQKILTGLARSEKARIRELENVLETLSSGNPSAAEAMIDKLYDEVYYTAGLLPPADKQTVMGPISQVEVQVRTAMRGERTRQLREAIDAERAAATAGTDALLQALNQEVGGPDRLEKLIADWKKVHLQQLRVSAVAASPPSNVPGAVNYAGDNPSSEAGDEAIFEQDRGRIKAAVVDFVARDIAATSPDEARKNLLAYNELLGDLLQRSGDIVWIEQLQTSLLELADKAGLRAAVLAYEAATRDLLRWRERVATAQAAAQTAPSLVGLAKREMMSDGPRFVGLYNQEQHRLPSLLKAVPALIPDISQKLVGKQIRVTHSLALDGVAIWMTRFEDGFYCRLAASPVNSEAVASLKADLLCSAEQRPLTVLATAALRSAEQGGYSEIGGTLTGFALEGLTARLATVPTSASDLVPLGGPGPDFTTDDPLRSLAIRCNVTPIWIRHRYFFVAAAQP